MYVHCNKCHHEWECTDEDGRKCDWCGGGSYILGGAPTLLEYNLEETITKLRKMNNPLADKVIDKILRNLKYSR